MPLSATIPLELFDFQEAQDNFTWIKPSYVPLGPAISAARVAISWQAKLSLKSYNDTNGAIRRARTVPNRRKDGGEREKGDTIKL